MNLTTKTVKEWAANDMTKEWVNITLRQQELIIDRTTSQGLGNAAQAATTVAGAGCSGQKNEGP